MSFTRSLLRSSAPLPRRAVAPLAPARTFVSSSSKGAAAGTGDGHGHEQHAHGASSAEPEMTHESWFTRPFIKVYILLGLFAVTYPFLPERNLTPVNPEADVEGFKDFLVDPKTPWLTKQIGIRYLAKGDFKQEMAREKIKYSVKKAEDRLMYQDAERPEVMRIRNRGTFGNASPFSVPVGSTTEDEKRETVQ